MDSWLMGLLLKFMVCDKHVYRDPVSRLLGTQLIMSSSRYADPCARFLMTTRVLMTVGRIVKSLTKFSPEERASLEDVKPRVDAIVRKLAAR